MMVLMLHVQVDLAVAIVIGTAFTAVVKALVGISQRNSAHLQPCKSTFELWLAVG